MARPKKVVEEVVVKAKEESITYVCTSCGKDKKEGEFYVSNSFIYKNVNKLPICKDCVVELYEKLHGVYKTDIKTIYKCCEMLDTCYERGIYDQAIKQYSKGKNKDIISIYFQKANSLPQYRGKSFCDSDKLNEEESQSEFEASSDYELVKKWGRSHDEEELKFLEEHYFEWTTHNDCNKMSVQKLVKMICEKELEIEKGKIGNSNTEKAEKALLTLMDSSSLTPKSMSALNETDSAKIYGIWLRDIELYKPAEYFKDKKLYKDFDHLLEYYQRFIFRPLKNLLTGTREFDKEFNVEDEMEQNDENDDA